MAIPDLPFDSPRSGVRIAVSDLAFYAGVPVAYLLAVFLVIHHHHLEPDRMMVLAERVLAGHLDSPSFANTVDSVAINGRYYIAVGPLQVLPYLPFVAFPSLYRVASFATALAFGIPAAWLSLPLARRYGARGTAAYWVAVFTALGSLLFFVSVFGGFYYLAHAEAFLFLELMLLEWAGSRRPAVLGLLFGLAFLARPTTILALVPFGLYLLWRRRDVLRTILAVGSPVGLAIAVYGAFNWARFGSVLDAGYASSVLATPALVARRQLGLFSIRQIPENIRLALLQGFVIGRRFPYLSVDPSGLSMLLVSPALLTSLWAGVRTPTARLLWVAAGIVALPVFLYYGGGYVQYGFRYSLDFTPFLVALVAMGSSRWLGWPEKLLVVLSVASLAFGILWRAGILA